MSIFRVSPTTHTITVWRNWEEWTECYKNFFPDTEHALEAEVSAKQRKAIDTVNAWRARGRVPLAVESTAQLVELNLQHRYPPTPASSFAASSATSSSPTVTSSWSSFDHSTLQSRMSYSLCLLRFVNGILDPLQTKQHAQAISTLAKQMQLPRVLVDLRHESTHQALPSLGLLQHASLTALDWLQKHYWIPQAHKLDATEQNIRTALKNYKKLMEHTLEADKNSQRKDQHQQQQKQQEKEDDIMISINSGDTIMLDSTAHAAAQPSSAAMSPKATEALKSLLTTISSGSLASHSTAIITTKLIPTLFSPSFATKPPKVSRASLSVSAVFKKLVKLWTPGLAFLQARCQAQNNSSNFWMACLKHITAALAEALKDATSPSAEEEWHWDLLREWAEWIAEKQITVTMFNNGSERGAGLADSPTVTGLAAASKKRSHAAMSASSVPVQPAATASAPAMPSVQALEGIVFRCFKHLNAWLCPVLMHLFPVFKHVYSTTQAAAVARLEALMQVMVKAQYPQYRYSLGDAVSTRATSSASVPSLPVDIAQALRRLLDSRSADTTSHAAPSSNSAAVGTASRRVHDFPFLPLGFLPTAQPPSLLLGDEWLPVDGRSSAAQPRLLSVVSQSSAAAVARPVEADAVANAQAASKRARMEFEVPQPQPPFARAGPTHKAAAMPSVDPIEALQRAIVWI